MQYVEKNQRTKRKGMRLRRRIVEESIGAPRSEELLVNETTEGRADHTVIRQSLRHTTHDEIDVVGMGINCAQFPHHLTRAAIALATHLKSVRCERKRVLKSYLCGNVVQEIVESLGGGESAIFTVVIVPWEAMIATAFNVQANGIQAQIIAVAGVQFARHLQK